MQTFLDEQSDGTVRMGNVYVLTPITIERDVLPNGINQWNGMSRGEQIKMCREQSEKKHGRVTPTVRIQLFFPSNSNFLFIIIVRLLFYRRTVSQHLSMRHLPLVVSPAEHHGAEHFSRIRTGAASHSTATNSFIHSDYLIPGPNTLLPPPLPSTGTGLTPCPIWAISIGYLSTQTRTSHGLATHTLVQT